MATKIGQRYRDIVTGVVGTAKAKGSDPEGKLISLSGGEGGGPIFAEVTLTQLQLERVHIEGAPESDKAPDAPNAHDMRWYQDDRLVVA